MLGSMVLQRRWARRVIPAIVTPSSLTAIAEDPRRYFSDRKPAASRNAANLRNSRKKPSLESSSEDGVDYRYRKGQSAVISDDEVAARWGAEAQLASNECQAPPTIQRKPQSKEFISFFDEIDSLMEERKREKSNIHSSKSGSDSVASSTARVEPKAVNAIHKLMDDVADKKPSKLGLAGRSIFDAFPIPEPPPPPNPNAYDEEAYGQYRALVDEALSDTTLVRPGTKRGLRNDALEMVTAWLHQNEKSMHYDYPEIDKFVREGVSEEDTSAKLRHQLQNQRLAFLEKHNMTEKQFRLIKAILKRVGNLSAKRGRSAPLEVAIEKIKEAGVLLGKTSINNYLYTVTTFAGSSTRRRRNLDRPTGGGSVLDMLHSKQSSLTEGGMGAAVSHTEGGEEDEAIDIAEEIAAFHDMLYEPTEQTLVVRVKALVAKGRAKAAEDLLNILPSEEGGLRRRTFFPVMRCYLEQGDVSSGLRLFKKMRSTPTVLMEPETYVLLISTLVEYGYFSHDAHPIEGAEQLGYSTIGPALLDQLINEMAEDALEISSASARRLYGAFEFAYRSKPMARNLSKLHPLAPLVVGDAPASEDELVVGRVRINPETGVCPRTNARLRLITLDDDEKRLLGTKLVDLAGVQLEKLGGTRPTGITDTDAQHAMEKFAAWLDERTGDPYTAIVDGANVAFYMQNFERGKFNFHQIRFMVDTLERMGEKPLVILPHKYGFPFFKIFKSGKQSTNQKLGEDELEILQGLIDEDKLYRVESGCLDDFYWMMASVSDQSNSRKGKDMAVQAQDGSGRWPGMRPMLVTNDMMRDHRLELVEPRLFRRWYSSFIVNYNFTAFYEDECVDKEIGFSTADFFSREIQGNPTYRDSEGASIGTAWHFPVSDWEANERFCLRLPLSEEQQ